MGQQFQELSAEHRQFITAQKVFFVATTAAGCHINLSPKGMDSFTVLDGTRVAWLNVTGSGNETSAHVQRDPRMTIMFCSFAGKPLILRLYGTANVIHPDDMEWDDLFKLFPPLPGVRQIFDLRIDLVQTSCGMSVPLFNYVGERDQLNDWARAKGEEGIRNYWETRNQLSIDGVPTNIIAKSH